MEHRKPRAIGVDGKHRAIACIATQRRRSIQRVLDHPAVCPVARQRCPTDVERILNLCFHDFAVLNEIE
jgi:hypothetical protein